MILALMQETTVTGLAADEAGFSLIGLLLEADPIVQAVLVILLIASIWSWAIIVEKFFALGGARRSSRKFEESFWNGSMEDMDARPGAGSDPAARVFASVSREWNDARRGIVADGHSEALVSRAERTLRAAVDREVTRQSGGLGVLASVASASPFIGLFGTVWGIMNAFIEIAERQDTSLAAVGGPIAEALFATGLGLIAAIPAVIFYNKFSTDLNRLADQLDSFSQDVLVRLSRRVHEPAGV
jgi:biopolymer transport protein TolQ